MKICSMKKLLIIVPVSILLLSCQKENIFKEAKWYESTCSLGNGIICYSGPNVNYQDFLDSFRSTYDFELNKIEKISSYADLAEFDSITKGTHTTVINGECLMQSVLGSTNFSENNIFIFYVPYYSQGCGEIKKNKILINESSKEISFDFKMNVRQGGSSTVYFSKYFFLSIPKEYEDYCLFGRFHVNAKNASLGAGADDSVLNFSL